MSGDSILKNDEACSAGEEFQKLFYESFDKRRAVCEFFPDFALKAFSPIADDKVLGKLYMETATMVWNGHLVEGSKKIVEFLENLPVSEHKVDLLDCHPILDAVTNGQTSIMVMVGGKVNFQGNKTFPFNENFVLTSQQGKWKIASNTFRYFE